MAKLCGKCGKVYDLELGHSCDVDINLSSPILSFCEWVPFLHHQNGKHYVTSCGNDMLISGDRLELFEFCPFKGCGKKIHIKDGGENEKE